MLATLYDLEIVEDLAVRDWLDPPSENRHPFLKQAKAVFAVKDNVEAKKQVLCVLVYVHIPCLYVYFGAVCRAALVFSLFITALRPCSGPCCLLLPGKVNKDLVKRSPNLVHEVDQMF